MEYYDTIIIGCGLAGCTLGNLLLDKKEKVLIIENKDLKRKNKLCGGIITPKAYKLMLKIYKNKLNKLKCQKFNSFIIKNNEELKIINNNTLYTIYRKELDDFVINEYLQNGGKIIDKTDYEKIDFKNKILYLSGKTFKYKNLVGADGVFSKVRKDLTGKNQKMNFALEKEYSKKSKMIQINFFNNFKGYAWTIPSRQKTLIGLGNISKKTNIKNTFLNHFNLENDNTIRGAFLPTGRDIFLKKRNIYFIGDAAGLVSPVTGEGIYFAISSAYNLSKSMNSFYKISMLKDRFIIFKHRISKIIIYNATIRNFFFKLYQKSKIISFLINKALKSFL